MGKIRVLVVDDHAIMRDGIKALLSTDPGMEVIGEASEGREAVEKVRELQPDIVIMDIGMPGMDGLEATRQITRRNSKVKVLILTQHDDKEYVLSTVKAGASGYVSKKAVGSDLIQAIKAIYSGESFLHPTAAAALIEGYRQKSEEQEPYDTLTAREREILKLIAEGHTNNEIAESLFISSKTVAGHRANIMQKLDLHNRTELIKYAMRKKLITVDT